MTAPAPYCPACKHHRHEPGRCSAQPGGGVVCCSCEGAAPPRCPTCGHAKNRHDPEDGTCDAPAEVGLGVCPCGRAPAAPPRSSAGSCHDHGNCELCDQQEAEIARLLAVIEALPHEDDCETKYSHRPCNCAKSKAVAK